jgi:hypothetical protein
MIRAAVSGAAVKAGPLANRASISVKRIMGTPDGINAALSTPHCP